MTVIDQIKNEITDKAGTLVWSAALVASLGDPRDWEYTGDCVQGDPSKTHCACGHPIMATKTKSVPLAVLRLLAKWAIQSVRIVKKANK